MSKAIIAGKEYEIPEITFEEICRLEENGIYLLNMDPKQRNVATILRGLVAWIMDVEPAAASMAIQKHIEDGGNILDVFEPVQEAIRESGFFGEKKPKVQKMPQDHQSRQNRKRNTNRSRN